MRIEQSVLYMSSGHRIEEQHSRTEKLEAWAGAAPGTTPPPQDRVSFSQEISDRYSAALMQAREACGLDDAGQYLDPKLSIIKRLIELFTGRQIDVTGLSELNDNTRDGSACCRENDAANAETQPMEGWGVRYDLQESYSESERTSVAVQGIVRTSDGREVAFDLNLQMERSYVEQNSLSMRLGDAARIDPLVINFDGAAAQLTDWRFDFDLDADGFKEEIPFVSSGSGILVFDKNGDRQANNGAELFGPSTGNGFAELAALDEDDNKWIDENDSAYEALSIWRRDQEGNESLVSLAESDIGALNVGCIDSPFDLKDRQNSLRGQILRTGVYLSNAGTAGSMQQLDMAV